MEQSTRYIGMDVHKDTIVVAITHGRGWQRHALRHHPQHKRGAAAGGDALAPGWLCRTGNGSGTPRFCYEAGPCGNGIHRTLLATLHRGGLLTAVWVLDAAHEAICARLAAVRAVRTPRQRLSAFLLHHERVYPTDKTTWTKAHRRWLGDQSFAEPAQQIVLQESIEAVHAGEQRRDRVDAHLRAQIPSWSLYPLVRKLCALPGLDTIASAGVAAAIGDASRFATAADFMAYLGPVPSVSSSGPKRRTGAITKAGDIHART